MRSPDGQEQLVRGVYREIVPPRRLVFTNVAMNPDGDATLDGVTTVTFDDLGGKTRLTLCARVRAMDGEAAIRLAGMDAGWSQSLERLVDHVERK